MTAKVVPIRPTVLSFVVDEKDVPQFEGVRGFFCKRHQIQGFDMTGRGCPLCVRDFQARFSQLCGEILRASRQTQTRLLEVYEVDGQTCIAIDGVEVLRLPPKE